jgi:CheY-specific phosphatase CheX
MLKADVVNAFLDPVVTAWRDQLSVEVSFKDAATASGPFETGDLAAVIGVSGLVKGNVFYEFPEPTALALTHAIGGAEKREVDSDVFQVVQDLANAIWAAVPGRLRAAGHESQVTSPILLAKGASVTLDNPSLVASFTSPLGPMSVHISIVESTK